MGLLGKLAGGGFFGLTGLMMSKKKKKKPLVPPPAMPSIASTGFTGSPNIERDGTSAQTFSDAFKERSKSIGDEEEARREKMRAGG